jgi:hypothetical protein
VLVVDSIRRIPRVTTLGGRRVSCARARRRLDSAELPGGRRRRQDHAETPTCVGCVEVQRTSPRRNAIPLHAAAPRHLHGYGGGEASGVHTLSERAPKDGEHGAVLVSSRLLLGPDQRGEIEHPERVRSQDALDGFGEQIFVALPIADLAEDVERTATGDQQVMAFAGERRALRPEDSTGEIAIARVELGQRGQ